MCETCRAVGVPIFTAGRCSASNRPPLIMALICFCSAALTARGSGYGTEAQRGLCVRARAIVHVYINVHSRGWRSFTIALGLVLVTCSAAVSRNKLPKTPELWSHDQPAHTGEV